MSTLSYQLLRKNVEHRLGLVISSARECRTLSKALSDVCQAIVSETTIKRFWGIVNSDIKPSKFTLNALARYIGYRDFPDFENGLGTDDDGSGSSWESFRTQALDVSCFTLNSLKSRMGFGRYSATIRRGFTREFFEGFMASGKVCTALVAPSGWGKSVTLAHIVEEYFLPGGSPCYGDLVFYFDLSSLSGFSKYENMLEDMALSLIGGSGGFDFKTVFMRHPGWRKGDVYFLVDGIANEEHARKMISIVNNYAGEGWFRLIFATRPTAWIIGSRVVPLESQRFFYGLDFNAGATGYCNMPSFDMYERFQVIKSSGLLSHYSFRLMLCPETRLLLGVPAYLSLLLDQCMVGDFSEMGYLWAIFKRNVALRSSQMRLQGFLAAVLEATMLGRRRSIVVDSRLFQAFEYYRDVFEIFVAIGVIEVEFFDDRRIDVGTKLSFSDSRFFEFVLFSYWINHSDGVPGKALMERISAYYSGDEQLKLRELMWMVRYAFREGMVDCINSVFDFAGKAFQNPAHAQELRNLLCLEYSSSAGLSGKVLTSDSELIYYICDYCDIDHFDTLMRQAMEEVLARPSCAAYHLRVYMLYLYSYFLHFDVDGFDAVYARMEGLLDSMYSHSRCDSLMGLAAQMMCEFMHDGHVSDDMLRYVEDCAAECFSGHELFDVRFLNFGFFVLDVLVTTSNYEICRHLSSIILEAGGGRMPQYMYNLALAVKMTSLLHLGRSREAGRMAMSVKFSEWITAIPAGRFHFFTMRLVILFSMLMDAGCEVPLNLPAEAVSMFRDMMLRHFRHERFLSRFIPS